MQGRSDTLTFLAESINNPDLAVTIFAPTNDAFLKRLPSITKPNGIQPSDLFTVGKSDALRGIVQYHILSTVIEVSALLSVS